MVEISNGYSRDGWHYEIYEKRNGYGVRITYPPTGIVEYYNLLDVANRREARFIESIIIKKGVDELREDEQITTEAGVVEAKFVMRRGAGPLRKGGAGAGRVGEIRIEADTVTVKGEMEARREAEAVEYREEEIAPAPKVERGLGREEVEALENTFERILIETDYPTAGPKYKEWRTMLRDNIRGWSRRVKDLSRDNAYREAERMMINWIGEEIFDVEIE